MPKFLDDSSRHLKTCVWDLQQVFQEVIKYYPCEILEGHRGEQKQNESNPEVAWPDGKHNGFPSNSLHAVPGHVDKTGNWHKDMAHFYQFAAIVKFVGRSRGLEIRWGGDNPSVGFKFSDLIHFEL